MPTIESLPTMLTVAQVAKELQISKNRVYELLYVGEIPYKRISESGIRISRAVLEEWARQPGDLRQVKASSNQPSRSA